MREESCVELGRLVLVDGGYYYGIKITTLGVVLVLDGLRVVGGRGDLLMMRKGGVDRILLFRSFQGHLLFMI